MTNQRDAWKTSSTMSEDEILSQLSDVVSNPSVSFNKEQDPEKIFYFSQEQLVSAFKLGMEQMFDICYPTKKRGRRKKDNTYSRMRKMDVNDVIEVQVSDWGAARAAATKLKEQFGVKYETHRIRNKQTLSDFIQVTRIS